MKNLLLLLFLFCGCDSSPNPSPDNSNISSDPFHISSIERSPQWEKFRKNNIKTRCEWCGTTKQLELHHIEPFHLFPEKELDPTNVVTLCRPHHFEIGHKRNWKDYDINIKDEIKKRKGL